MPRPDQAPLPENFFSGGAFLTTNDAGLRAYLNALEGRVDAVMSPEDLPKAPAYANIARPDPATIPAGSIIFNTDDGTLNVSDGTNWRDMTGVIT